MLGKPTHPPSLPFLFRSFFSVVIVFFWEGKFLQADFEKLINLLGPSSKGWDCMPSYFPKIILSFSKRFLLNSSAYISFYSPFLIGYFIFFFSYFSKYIDCVVILLGYQIKVSTSCLYSLEICIVYNMISVESSIFYSSLFQDLMLYRLQNL